MNETLKNEIVQWYIAQQCFLKSDIKKPIQIKELNNAVINHVSYVNLFSLVPFNIFIKSPTFFSFIANKKIIFINSKEAHYLAVIKGNKELLKYLLSINLAEAAEINKIKQQIKKDAAPTTIKSPPPKKTRVSTVAIQNSTPRTDITEFPTVTYYFSPKVNEWLLGASTLLIVKSDNQALNNLAEKSFKKFNPSWSIKLIDKYEGQNNCLVMHKPHLCLRSISGITENDDINFGFRISKNEELIWVPVYDPPLGNLSFNINQFKFDITAFLLPLTNDFNLIEIPTSLYNLIDSILKEV